jgi:hypothetical protein
VGSGAIEATQNVQGVVQAHGAHVVEAVRQRHQYLPPVGAWVVGLVGLRRAAVGADHVDPAIDDRRTHRGQGLAMTAIDLLADPGQLERAKAVFQDDIRSAPRKERFQILLLWARRGADEAARSRVCTSNVCPHAQDESADGQPTPRRCWTVWDWMATQPDLTQPDCALKQIVVAGSQSVVRLSYGGGYASADRQPGAA